MEKPSYRIHSYPRSRLATFDVGRIGGSKHHIASFLEIDVTDAKRRVREILRSGGDASIMAWLIRSVAVSVARHPEVAAVNTRHLKQIIFDDVDIAVPMERIVNGDKAPIMTLIRKAESKSVETVAKELREAATRPINGSADYTPAERKNRRMERVFFYIPGVLRRVVWRMLMRDPFSIKKNMGSLVITNIGMSGRTSGWILPKSMHNLSIAMGTIVKKPRVVMGEVAVRDVMNLTIVFDHDVIDGAPAARFADTLVKLMESAEGL